jgi:HD-GYP domain-containing protein (c-di-GMP phosphodiesterase class II)
MNVATGSAQRVTLLHGPGFGLDGIRTALDAEGVEARTVPGSLVELEATHRPTVLILDDDLVARESDLPAALGSLDPWVAVVAIGYAAERAAAAADRLFLALPASPDTDTLLRVLQAGFRHAAIRLGAARADAEVRRTRGEIQELNQIGMALMTERDPDRLLVKILDRAMTMTDSDGGSLYLVEAGEDGAQRLRFTLSESRSLPDLPFVEFTLPIDRSSIAGYAAAANEPLVLDDAYAIPEDAPYSINRSFDERVGYRTKSMLVVPMADHRDEVVGVLQLINRKSDIEAVIRDDESAARWVLPYRPHEISLVQGLAGQAAVSIENSRLYQQIEHIFESFVKAAVAAIDQRDPTTAGHSVRVAALTTAVAEKLPRLTAGPFAGHRLAREQMKELRYAALLHDFGKVGVREEVLVKAKKLPPYLWERVQARFDLIHRTIERDCLSKKLALTEQHEIEGFDGGIERLDHELRTRLDELRTFREAIGTANEPTILPEEGAAVLQVIAGERFEDIAGEEVPYLREEELGYLSIPKGTLDERERKEIESHVTQTYRFLTQIPWTEDLVNVAEIAYGHHEKLDGRGYPRGIDADAIPVQTRIMTIADIFDAALTSAPSTPTAPWTSSASRPRTACSTPTWSSSSSTARSTRKC